MRRLFASALIAGAVLAAGTAEAGWVFYFHVFGKWTVVCDKNLGSGAQSCKMSTPPPELTGAMERLRVEETAADAFRVTAEMAPWADARHPLSLGIDGQAEHPATPERWGPVTWDGTAAVALVGEMNRGKQAYLRSFDEAGQSREESFDLTGFPEALAALRRNLRAHGILGGN